MESMLKAGTLIAGENLYYSKDSYKTQLNNNVIVVGASGTGKTRGIVTPNLLQAEGSYVVSDPKGNLYSKYKHYFRNKGYNVLHMNFIHPEKSMRYNPITRCKTQNDISILAHSLVYGCRESGENIRSQDPFWPQTSYMLLCSLIAYMKESDEVENKDFKTMEALVRLMNRTGRNGGLSQSALCELMENHAKRIKEKEEESWAWEIFQNVNMASDRTYLTICISTLAYLAKYGTKEIRQMMSGNDIDFERIGQEKTIIFVEVSDTDRSKDVLVNLFYSQLMNALCSYADEQCKDSRLPVPVQFLLDDFATNAVIDNFENIISNIRSRNISTTIMLQSENQLSAKYGDNAATIVDNCNTYIYMGGGDPTQAELVAKRANKSVYEILKLPIGYSWVFRRGEEPIMCKNFDVDALLREKQQELVDELECEKEEVA